MVSLFYFVRECLCRAGLVADEHYHDVWLRILAFFPWSTEQLGPSPQNHRAKHELRRAARCSVLGAATVSNFGWFLYKLSHKKISAVETWQESMAPWPEFVPRQRAHELWDPLAA